MVYSPTPNLAFDPSSAALRCCLMSLALLVPAALLQAAEAGSRIDRQLLVKRHEPVLRFFDNRNPLTVGNGQFAFTADPTGLQTFPDAYSNTIPLCTLSQWGWHSFPNPFDWNIDRYELTPFDVFGRKVGYADIPGDRRTPEVIWLRGNPHRLHLGRIGFVLRRADGSPAQPGDLNGIHQRLALWEGTLHSHFVIENEPVDVITICHPERDALAVRVISPLLEQGRLGIQIQFPYGSGALQAADWSRPNAHDTLVRRPAENCAEFLRRLDQDSYALTASWTPGARLVQSAQHHFTLNAAGKANALELVCVFAPKSADADVPSFEQTQAAAAAHWRQFWSTGGAIDLSQSKDPRWTELERRIVLSQYLTAIQCSGVYPPQETGLTCNSWEGKFHLEMHWWHAAHFALWDRLPLLEKSLGYYDAILARARATARRQGYDGARWPKMTDPSGAESPSTIGPFLIWQQPHPIFYAELCRRLHPNPATLERYKEIVHETAAFMASYPAWDEARQCYVLGPVLQCAQEIFPKNNTLNPTFELTYWRWGLETAQQWRIRLGLEREPKWDRVLDSLAKPALENGCYLFAETAPGTYSQNKWNRDHPAVVAAFGMLPGPDIDPQTMRRTLDWIWRHWNWPDTWGWDCPMLAMCAARVGDPELAIDALLLDAPKNQFAPNGHNYQRPGLPVYLPGNGAFLYAVAMMAQGWDGAPAIPAPGFPRNGRWIVHSEDLNRAP